MKHLAVIATVLVLGVLAPGLARADRLDRKLNEEMPGVMKHLGDRGYRNVGVLRFRVKRGGKPARFDNAPLNGGLATRLENLLIIHGGPSEAKAIGVIRDAGPVAARQKVGSWSGSAAERKKLFEIDYPLAWGKKKVRADAFLTGLVEISADLKETTIEMTCLRPNRADDTRVARFALNTDRNLVRDLGYSYVLSASQREELTARRQGKQIDKFVVDAVAQGEEKPADDRKPKPSQATPSQVAGIEVKMLVDGKARKIAPTAAKGDGPRWQVESPPPDRPIAFTLRNTTDKPLGVVLKLNGTSTIDEQTEAADNCRKWVVPPGKTFTIRGFYLFGKNEGADRDARNDPKPGNGPSRQKATRLPFKVLVGEEARNMKVDLGDRFGLIEIDVFAEGKPEEPDEELMVSARGLPPSKEKQARGSYKALRTALLVNARLKTTMVASREVIVPDREAARRTGPVKVVDFTGHAVGRLTVKVVPKEDRTSY